MTANMTTLYVGNSALQRIIISFILISFSTNSALTQQQIQQSLPDIDIRYEQLPSLVQTQFVQSTQMAAFKEMQTRIHALKVNWNTLTGTPKSVYTLKGYMTPPSQADPHTIVLDFVRNEKELFGINDDDLRGLLVTRDFTTKQNGVKHLIFQQIVNEIIVYSGELRANLTAQGELINTAGELIPSVSTLINRTEPVLTPVQAIRAAADNIESRLTASPILVSGPEGPMLKQVFHRGNDFGGDIPVRILYFPMNRTEVRLVWEVVLAEKSSPDVYQIFIDAEDGRILFRVNMTSYDVTPKWRVFTSDSPSPHSPGRSTPDGIQPSIVSRDLIETNGDPTASPEGWIPDGVNTTTGNNVDAYIDADNDGTPDAGTLDNDGRPVANANREFDYALDLTAAPTTDDYRRSAVTNVFYWVNKYHDIVYNLGFNELAGNFQNDNFEKGGAGGDYIRAEVQDGSDNPAACSNRNNANFYTPIADGDVLPYPPRMQMYIFSGPNPNRDGDLDAEVFIHELTHGLTKRMVGGPTVSGLTLKQSKAIGEGLSDFYALSILSESGDNINGNYAYGGYVTYNLDLSLCGVTTNFGDNNYYFGIRRFPYNIDIDISPLTFADIDPAQFSYNTTISASPFISIWDGGDASGVHNAGEIWCLALLECRANLINYYGHTIGNQLILELVTHALPNMPAQPTFVEARDFILAQDMIDNGGLNQCLLWAGFAKRGMGPGAIAPAATTTSGVVESFHDALPEPDATRSPVDIILVLDVSGSMSSIAPGGTEPKIEVLWDAVEMFINSWVPFAIPGDRMGIVFFESGVTSFPITIPKLIPLCANAKEIVETIRAETAGGYTAMGGGLLNGKNGFETGSPNNRFIVLFTDGMQNYSPLVLDIPPLEIHTRPVDIFGTPPVFGESYIPGEPGLSMADYGVDIHVIGVGVSGSYQSLLENIAMETGGLCHFTSAPDDVLRNFYEMSLVTALSTTSVERVNHFVNEYRNDMGEQILRFHMNRSANRAAFILSWRGDERPNAMTFRLISPDNMEIDLTAKIRNGDFYKIVALSLPFMQNDSLINHEGEWQMIISGKLTISSTVYDASLLLDESELKFDFSIADKDYGTGDPITIYAKVKEGDIPIKNLQIAQVSITRPDLGFGSLLAEHSVDPDSLKGNFGLDPDHFPTMVEKKQYFLMQNPHFREIMNKRFVDYITLYDNGTNGDLKAGDGIYSATYTETTRPGLYDFEFLIKGEAPKVGEFYRTEIFSSDVRVKVPDANKTDVTALEKKWRSKEYQIGVVPFDKFDNYLGPGYVNAVKITSSAGILSKVEDGLDGTYNLKLKLSAIEDAKTTLITAKVLGDTVRKATLYELLFPKKRWGFSLHAGTTIPIGDFNTNYDPGISISIDFEYRITNNLSLEVLSSYHQFASSNSGNFYFINFSGNLKYYLAMARILPYINGGGGAYIPESGKNSFGINAGTGVSFRLSPVWYIETGYNFHHVFTEVQSSEFSTIQAGLRFRF